MGFKKIILIVSLSGLFISGCTVNGSEETTVQQDEQLILNETVVSEEEHTNQSIEAQNNNNQDESLKSIVIPTIVNEGTIVNPDNIMAVVNKNYLLPSSYEPTDLVIPNIPFYFEEDIPKRYIRAEAAQAIEKLFNKAKEDGIPLLAASGYRSFERQSGLFNAKAAVVGVEEANTVVAFPGESEHQTGLAMDVTTSEQNFQLEEEFGTTVEGEWLQENAHLFGFIIRYPKGKELITGYKYEPWHIRYVGLEAATEIFENNLTLEEFVEKYNAVQVNKELGNTSNG
ncbi:M15 family metallopeptidase [Bacillus sp. Marseille-P3661]|uniref:M15 family metallopeptidase n=1 Tax=Bacillus sp. Marseille-P3661 TaxID=1936234 RepID=UPI000C84E913|nr:M15 family metallopeptidase [Bacillus sp. Marseille-P3661]